MSGVCVPVPRTVYAVLNMSSRDGGVTGRQPCRSLDQRATAAHQSDEEQHDGDDQQHMDECTDGIGPDHPEQPGSANPEGGRDKAAAPQMGVTQSGHVSGPGCVPVLMLAASPSFVRDSAFLRVGREQHSSARSETLSTMVGPEWQAWLYVIEHVAYPRRSHAFTAPPTRSTFPVRAPGQSRRPRDVSPIRPFADSDCR